MLCVVIPLPRNRSVCMSFGRLGNSIGRLLGPKMALSVFLKNESSTLARMGVWETKLIVFLLTLALTSTLTLNLMLTLKHKNIFGKTKWCHYGVKLPSKTQWRATASVGLTTAERTEHLTLWFRVIKIFNSFIIGQQYTVLSYIKLNLMSWVFGFTFSFSSSKFLIGMKILTEKCVFHVREKQATTTAQSICYCLVAINANKGSSIKDVRIKSRKIDFPLSENVRTGSIPLVRFLHQKVRTPASEESFPSCLHWTTPSPRTADVYVVL